MLITPLHKSYPRALYELKNPPNLDVLGRIVASDQKAIAIVGARQMTSYGQLVARQFSTELVNAGYTIISGLARGIDAVAHAAAINAHGRTIAVLGSGIDVIYPPENANLCCQIAKHGAVVSQFKEGTQPLPKNFLARNFLIAALSKAVLVIEGARRSGTISTVHHAANLGKEVFAVPGPINSKQSEGPNYLIKEGAHIVTEMSDILDIID